MRPASAPIRSDRIEVQTAGERPRLTLVERLGDPNPALALAIAHDGGSLVSVAVSTLIEQRLQHLGYPATERHAHDLGFQLATLVSDAADARRFMLAARQALEEPVAKGDPTLSAVAAALKSLGSRQFSGNGARAAAACSGELGVRRAGQIPNVESQAGVETLERWRHELVNASRVSFAAVGSRAVLEQAARAHQQSPPWPAGPGSEDAWPDQDFVSVETEPRIEPTVTVALRVADASRAIQAASELALDGSRLKQQLSSLFPAWSLSRSIATARVRGACLRLDMRIERGAPSVVDEVARVAFIAEREAERALDQAAKESFVLDQRILMAADPRSAASLAAWRAQISREPTGPERRIISVRARPNLPKNSSNELRALLTKFSQGKSPDTERRLRVEPGQGEIWMLLASRCGTLNEGMADAGHSALLMHALASRATRRDGVSIEPWVLPDAVGLLAHAPRRGVHETPEAHARRVGRALADAFATTPVTFEHTSLARQQLLDALGPETNTAWGQTLVALSPEHPSWLEPRGTLVSIAEATKTNLEQRHQILLSEPLRAAVIANRTRVQARAGLDELGRWLAPMRGAPLACPKGKGSEPRLGRIEVKAADDSNAAGALVAVRTPPDEAAARATQYLLNRKRGWLDQALSVPGLVTSARAHLLGGGTEQALVVEVRALDGKTREAVDQVRALFDRLAQGACQASDVTLAQRALEAELGVAQLNPRGRLARLWAGSPRRTALTLAGLRGFQRALAGSRHLVVSIEDSP